MHEINREAVGYLVAILAVGVALVVRLLLHPLLGDYVPFITFFAAVVVATWYGGWRPGIVATLLSLIAVWLFILPSSVEGLTGPHVVGLIVFFFMGSLLSGTVGRLLAVQRSSRQNEVLSEQRRQEATALGDELRKRVEELDAILRVVPVGIFVSQDPACLNITANPAGARMLGIDPSTNASKSAPDADRLPFRILKQGVEVASADLPMQRAARTGETIGDAEMEIVHEDGSNRWLSEYAVPLFDCEGEVRGSVGAFVDITDRKRAESALRESEQLFKSLTSHAPVGIFKTDAEGNCQFVNERWCRLTGLTPEEAHGKGWLKALHPEDRDRVGREWYEAARNGTEFASEYRFQTSSGQVTWVSGSATALKDEQGRVRGHIGTITDITQQKQAEDTVRSLLRISERLNSTLDVEDLLDILVQEAISLVGAESGASGLRTPEGMVCKRYFQKGKVFPLEYCWPPLHGLPGWLLVHKVPYLTNDALHDTQIVHELCVQFGVRSALSTPIITADGEVVGFFEIHNKQHEGGFTATDQEMLLAVSQTAAIAVQKALAYRELRLTQKSLEEADRRKDEFLATLAHELRNPLAPLRNGLSLLRLEGDEGTSPREIHTMMERQLGQMVRLIDDLLDVSRISRGKLELKRSRVTLSAILNAAIETCRPVVEAAGHRLEISLPNEEISLDADSTRLAQSFSNLLNNACKFMEPAGRIALTATRQGDEVVVSVRDSGVGIPGPMLERIFEMFTQVDGSLERSHDGLGIGLTIVKRLIELHGGSVSVRSEGAGKGSEFLVRLPCESMPSSPSLVEDPLEPQELSAAATPRRILVADDNRDSAKTLALMLKALGNDVCAAHDGQEAIDLAESYLPDVIVLDIGMPRLNGYEAARHIRQQPWGKTAVLIALTGWGQADDKRRSRDAGFDHHLVKPVELAALKDVLQHPSVC